MSWNIGEHRYDQLAKVWSIEDKGNYAVVKLGTWRKDKKNGNAYKNSNWGFCRFVATAYDTIDELSEGDIIVIESGTISQEEYQDQNGNRAWPKNPQITIFAWKKSEPRESNSSSESSYVESDNGELDEMPF
jgi:hypothetical protein